LPEVQGSLCRKTGEDVCFLPRKGILPYMKFDENLRCLAYERLRLVQDLGVTRFAIPIQRKTLSNNQKHVGRRHVQNG
jgi:hypothetical protein